MAYNNNTNNYYADSHSPFSPDTSRPELYHQSSSYSHQSPSPRDRYPDYNSDPYYRSKPLPDGALSSQGAYGRSRMQNDNPFYSSDAIPLQSQTPKYDNGPAPLHRQPSDMMPLNPPPQESSQPSKAKGKFDWTRIPYVVYTVTLIQIIVFIAELVKSSQLTGSPIMTKPYFNPMIGPSPYVQINMGARYVPCMRNEDQVENGPTPINWPCPNSTDTFTTCSLSELCGLGGVPDSYERDGDLDKLPAPNQWYRFITAIFLHGGFIHITGNLLLQMLLARDMEKAIGSIRFALVYFSSGIWGFVLGGNYAANGLAATGCSGSLFGIIGLVFLDLFYTWSSRRRPQWDLFTLIFVVIVMVILGLLPTGLDNFSHIGGLLMGLVLGISILHSPNALRKHTDDQAWLIQHGDPSQKRRSQPISSDELVYGTTGASFKDYAKNPVGFFKGRKPLWWVWWLFRVGALVAVFVGFIVLLRNFYNTHSSNCHWCQYLSCLPIHDWCERGQLHPKNVTTTGPDPASSSGRPALLRL